MQGLAWSILLSLAIHMGFVYWLLRKPAAPTADEVIKIEVAYVGVPKGAPRGTRAGKGSDSLRHLLPRLPGLGAGKGATPELGSGEWSKEDWGYAGGDLQQLEHYTILQDMQEHIEGLLHYPHLLAAHNIQGTVNTRLVLSQRGCDWRQTKIWASESHLRVYVLGVLKKFCQLNVTRRSVVSPLTVDMSFQFALTESGLDHSKEHKHVVGNVLAFYRNIGKSRLEWRLGPFKGIFPIPAVNLDFQWLQENWEKYVEGRDPMEAFRDN